MINDTSAATHTLAVELQRRNRRIALCTFLFVWLFTGIGQGRGGLADILVSLLFATINGVGFAALAFMIGWILSSVRLRRPERSRRFFSTRRSDVFWPILSAAAGLGLGMLMLTTPRASATPKGAWTPAMSARCTEANIDATTVRAIAIHSAMWDGPPHKPSEFRVRLNNMLDAMPDCTSRESISKLPEPYVAKYGLTMLLGFCDAAVANKGAFHDADARTTLDLCLKLIDEYHAVGTARKWTSFFTFEKRFAPILNQLDKNLVQSGYPRNR